MMQETLKLFEALMSGHKMRPSELDDLLNKQVSEDLFLEYKHGDTLKGGKKASTTLRQYLSGFANSAGGTLVVGVDEKSWLVTGCAAPGGGDLSAWASRATTPIASYFSPPPRFQVVPHPDGKVLLASVERSSGLVPCVEKGKLRYYLRLHDQTLEAPEYLVSDILLGRRQHPYLEIVNPEVRALDRRHEPDGSYNLHLDLTFKIENSGFSWAEEVRFGLVSWTKYPSGITNLSNHLLSHIEVDEPDQQRYSERFHLSHAKKFVVQVSPFEVELIKGVQVALPLRLNNRSYVPYTWKAAIYVISKGAPPVWYQLSFTINSQLLERATSSRDLSFAGSFLDMQRLSGERPVVAWEDL